jgi:secreted PhoX family phosphatase
VTERLLRLQSSSAHPGGRNAMTCAYRCGNACAHPAPNPTANDYFGDIVQMQLSRRGLLRASALGALTAGLGFTGLSGATAAPAPHAAAVGSGRRRLTFTPVPPNRIDAVTVAEGYAQAVVIRWGDPVLASAPTFDFANQTAAAQAKQFGYNNDFLAVLPLGVSGERALLVANHEYTDEALMFSGYTTGAAATEEQIRICIAAHGMSVVEIVRVGHTGEWQVAHGRRRYNRRITGNTPMALTGPAAGSDLLKTPADPTGTVVLGTLNNCAGGTTPWGTVLTGEENFNQYFVGGAGVPAEEKPALARYGISTSAQLPSPHRAWERVEERFNLALHPHEANRFGYIVEIDPYDPAFVPRKRTMLGRFKHEGANVTIAADRRVVAYMGDDERFDYIYKFVSKKRYQKAHTHAARRHNLTLLDSGTLYVAKLTGDSPAAEIDGTGRLPSDGAFDGSGEWIPLCSDEVSYTAGMSVEQVLVHTRLAADKAGATKMDRPEDIEISHRSGYVYVALTNNDRRTLAQIDEANPRPTNRHGHILELVPARGDHTATSFGWNLPVICGDPDDPSTYFAGFDKTKVSPISCPDNLAFDAAGNLWIATDGNALGSNDGLFAMPIDGRERGHLKQFLTVPVAAETCGPVITADQRTCLVAVQHPGEVDGATPENPASTWPDGDQPRPAVVAVWRVAPGSKRIGV